MPRFLPLLLLCALGTSARADLTEPGALAGTSVCPNTVLIDYDLDARAAFPEQERQDLDRELRENLSTQPDLMRCRPGPGITRLSLLVDIDLSPADPNGLQAFVITTNLIEPGRVLKIRWQKLSFGAYRTPDPDAWPTIRDRATAHIDLLGTDWATANLKTAVSPLR